MLCEFVAFVEHLSPFQPGSTWPGPEARLAAAGLLNTGDFTTVALSTFVEFLKVLVLHVCTSEALCWLKEEGVFAIMLANPWTSLLLLIASAVCAFAIRTVHNNSQLTKENKQLKDENLQLIGDREILEDQLAETTGDLNQIKDLAAALELRAAKIGEKLARISLVEQAIQARVADLSAQVASSAVDTTKLLEKLHSREAEIAQIKAESTALLAERETELCSYRNERAALADELASSKLEAAKLLEALAREQSNFRVRTSFHHRLAHACRNLLVSLMREFLLRVANTAPTMPEFGRVEFEKMIHACADMFGQLVPLKVGLAVYLLARSGERFIVTAHTPKAGIEQRSGPIEALPAQSRTLEIVKEGFQKKGECAFLFRGGTSWQRIKHEWAVQDRCLMVSPIYSKEMGRQNPEPMAKELEWLLVVSADSHDAFNDSHLNLMRAAGDAFGTILNLLARIQPAADGAMLRVLPGGQSDRNVA